MTADEFVKRAEALTGRPYSEIDCNGVVRIAAGIRCQGTNWLWRSYDSSGKYRYLVERTERPPEYSSLRNGLLVFRVNWNTVAPEYTDRPNCYHVGIISGKDVIESKMSTGVTKHPYNPDEWSACGWLKQIDPMQADDLPFTDICGPELDTDDEPADVTLARIGRLALDLYAELRRIYKED